MIELIKKVAELKDKWGLNNAERQELKIFEEFGELCKAELEGDIEEIKDGIGDVFITLIIYFSIEGYNAWEINEILIDIVFFYHPNITDSKANQYVLNQTRLIAIKRNISIEKCIETEYAKVSQREGKTVNGTFIKNK
jgi:NTP pyrophosphatase (non-canonical NTP hydrolase)